MSLLRSILHKTSSSCLTIYIHRRKEKPYTFLYKVKWLKHDRVLLHFVSDLEYGM